MQSWPLGFLVQVLVIMSGDAMLCETCIVMCVATRVSHIVALCNSTLTLSVAVYSMN